MERLRERWSYAACPECLNNEVKWREGHRSCWHPDPAWKRLWDAGEADVVLVDGQWCIFRKDDEEMRLFLENRNVETEMRRKARESRQLELELHPSRFKHCLP